MNEARQIIIDLREDRLEEIAQRLKESPYRFDNALAKLRVIRGVAEGLIQQDPLEISANITNSLQGQRQQLDSLVLQLESFSPSQGDAVQVHSNLDSQIEGMREWWVWQVRPSLRPPSNIAGSTVDIQLARDSSREAAAEIEGLLAQVRGAAGVVAADALSGYYAKSVDGYSKRARNFLMGTIVALTVLAGLAIYAFLINPPAVHGGDQTTEVFIRSVLIRLLFLGIAGTAVAFTTRNYRVSKHLQVVNEAKRNALNTYALFAKSAPTADAQTLITGELVRSVFGLGDTGFLSTGGDTTIVEAQPALTALLHR